MSSTGTQACSLLIIITVAVVRQVGQGCREEGEVHGDPLSSTLQRWDSVLRVQGERGHVDRVPPCKSLFLLGSYRVRRRGVGALEEKGWEESTGRPRVQIISVKIKIMGMLINLFT